MNDLPRNQRAVTYLTEFGIATQAALNDPTSPQAKATKWIADEDEYNIEIPNPLEGVPGKSYTDSRFTERWALAVFYFSMGGDEWRYKLKFMLPIDHCDWFDRFVDPRGVIIRQGVTECQQAEAYTNAGNKVKRIEICKSDLCGCIPIATSDSFVELQPFLTIFPLIFLVHFMSLRLNYRTP